MMVSPSLSATCSAHFVIVLMFLRTSSDFLNRGSGLCVLAMQDGLNRRAGCLTERFCGGFH